MKYLRDLEWKIQEELDGAREYAEDYLEYKAHGNDRRATELRAMAQDELNHANTIHEILASEMSELAGVCTVPVDTQDAWDKAHRLFAEQSACIKVMLSL